MPEPTVFNGRYELHRRLGKGGMAEVFLARDLQLGRPVAVKVLFSQFANDPAFVERFRREAQAAANLNHPNIVSVYDWGQEHGTYYIVMEYVDGRSLADVLRAQGPLAPASAAEVATDIAAALGAAHQAGVLHRDIKPGNILVTDTGLVKVADWGIGRALDAAVEENLTQTGAVMGTATYFSPEQAQGLALDNRSDLYALGVVLFELLTGQPPFRGDSPVSIAYKHVQEAPPLPRSLNGSIPPELEAITLQLLQKRPDDRYATAEDLRADLRRYREGFRVHAMATATAAAAAAGATGASQGVPSADATVAVPTTYHVPEAIADDDWEEPERSRSGWFIVALVLLLGVLAGLLWLLASTLGVFDQETDGNASLVEVPRVVDLPVDEARELLEEAGFEVEETAEQVSDEAHVGLVLRQTPEGGIRIDEGSTVTIVVGSQNTFAMPLLAGSTPDQARNTLEGLGFTGEINERPEASTEVEAGQVITTEPAAGEQVATTATITLVVSSGPPQTEVPSCDGVSGDECASRLTTAGFTPDEVQEASGSVPAGQVIRTEPGAGTLADNGSTVRIVVSAGPAQVEVPAVEGLDEGSAIRALEDAGFVVNVERQGVEAGSPDDGVVLEQNPAGNSTATSGSTVTIVVGDSSVADVGD